MQLDHIVLAVPDLQIASQLFAEQTGCVPQPLRRC